MFPKIITISGLPGCGKSTTAELLASRLGYIYLDTGTAFRELAKKHNMSLHEFEIYSNTHHEIDKELDQTIIEQAQKCNGVVLQGRMAGWMCELNKINAFKIWLYLPIELRASRISKREGVSQDKAIEDINFRENSILKRYQDVYGINYNDISIYDTRLETLNKPEEVVNEIVNNLPNISS